MKTSAIAVLFITLSSICLGQIAHDSVSIYWPNSKLKYRTICCFVDTVISPDSDEPILVIAQGVELWDENGNAIDFEEYFETHSDIVVLEENPGIGADEKEYRSLISIADKAFSLLDTENISSINRAIECYVKAKEKIPDARYPDQKLEEIRGLTTTKPKMD